MTSRTGRFWQQTQFPESATYTNNRRGGWSYDADGNLLTDNSHENTFDAAGQQTLTLGPWNGCGREYDIEQQYDGDSRVARRMQTTRDEDYVGDPLEMSCTTTAETTYYVYASALGGVKLIELNASGNKVKGYVYGNGQRMAVQAVWSRGFSVSYHHANPGTGSWAETSSDRSVSRREMTIYNNFPGSYPQSARFDHNTIGYTRSTRQIPGSPYPDIYFPGPTGGVSVNHIRASYGAKSTSAAALAFIVAGVGAHESIAHYLMMEPGHPDEYAAGITADGFDYRINVNRFISGEVKEQLDKICSSGQLPK